MVSPGQKNLSLAEERLTEQRNPHSMNLDRLSTEEIIRLMNDEDCKIAAAVAREIPAITRAADAIVNGMQNGGRLFYVGAGSSGRLGVLDAAECAPTFGTSRKLVQALIAGGKRAVTNAVEGVARVANILIAPEVGPEVLTGSTRLKAGTAQKMVLNMLSTAAMVRLGHAYENLMIDLLSTNQKLSDRSLRILVEASGKSVSATRHALRKSGRDLRVALVMLKKNMNVVEAKQSLKSAGGNLRFALGES